MCTTPWLWAPIVVLALFGSVCAQDSQDAGAACSCEGIDYTNDGSYLIDRTIAGNFTFTSVFTGMWLVDRAADSLKWLTTLQGAMTAL